MAEFDIPANHLLQHHVEIVRNSSSKQKTKSSIGTNSVQFDIFLSTNSLGGNVRWGSKDAANLKEVIKNMRIILKHYRQLITLLWTLFLLDYWRVAPNKTQGRYKPVWTTTFWIFSFRLKSKVFNCTKLFINNRLLCGSQIEWFELFYQIRVYVLDDKKLQQKL